MRTTRRVALTAAFVACLLAVSLAPVATAATLADTSAGGADTARQTVTVTDPEGSQASHDNTTSDSGSGVSSTFETDDDGWRITGDAQGDGTAPDYLDSGGNPGGHICADDNVAGGTWYFSAPAKFLGDQTGAYGETLAFDIKQSSTDEQFAQDDIVLRNETTTIVYDFGNATAHPGTNWTGYSVPLDATDPGWTYDSGGAVSPAAFRTLLHNLTSLSIRGEYVSGSDTGCLDNVGLSQSTAMENQPPTANFSYSPTGPAPEEGVSFSANAADPDGQVVEYVWRIDGEPVAEGPSFDYAFPGPGEYTVELTATDDEGTTDSVRKTVTVAEGNQAPTVELDLSPAAPEPGEDVAFVAEATDQDGEVVAYRWTVDDRTVGERPELTYAFEEPGTYVVAVTVTDDDGATASASREVTVEGDEQSPTATPTPTETATPTPAGDLTLSAAWWHSPTAPLRGESVTLAASGPTDPAVTYRWDVDDDGSYETRGALASHVFTTAGDHTVTLQATLPDGSTETTTEAVAVADETVSQPGTGATVFWHAPVNPQPSETVTLVADVRADDETVAAYRWDVDADGQPDATGEVVTHAYPTEGRYTVDLTVEYSNGSTTTGTDTVVVGDAPAATATATATRTTAATRTATDGETASETPGEGTTGGGSPGFGLTAALAAFASLAARLVVGRRGEH